MSKKEPKKEPKPKKKKSFRDYKNKMITEEHDK